MHGGAARWLQCLRFRRPWVCANAFFAFYCPFNTVRENLAQSVRTLELRMTALYPSAAPYEAYIDAFIDRAVHYCAAWFPCLANDESSTDITMRLAAARSRRHLALTASRRAVLTTDRHLFESHFATTAAPTYDGVEVDDMFCGDGDALRLAITCQGDCLPLDLLDAPWLLDVLVL